MLNAIWLDTFVALCEAGHFTRTAAALNMTQPGVSQHVRKLEAQVGQPLLARDGKSFTLTPAGDYLLAIGRRRRGEERDLRHALGFDDPDVGKVSVACSGTMALLLYPRFLDLMTTARSLEIMLEATPEANIFSGVIEGRFDMGIVTHAPVHSRLEGESVGQDELCLLLPKGHPVPESQKALDTLGFIAHPDGLAHADELLGANFDDYPGVEQIVRRSFINQIGQIPDPVARGLGYTILPRSGISAYAHHDQVTIAALPSVVSHDLWLIKRRKRVLPARSLRIQKEIKAILQKL